MTRVQKIVIVVILLSVNSLAAQRVLYSPVVYDRYTTKFETAGKTSSYYWQLSERKIHSKHADESEQSFQVYDERLNLKNTLSGAVIPNNTFKEYFIAGKNYFDEMLLLQDSNRTKILLQRFSEDGSSNSQSKIIASFPFIESGNSFLLIRSEDKNRILLLCFESIPSSPPKLHAILFNENWHQLSYIKYEHLFITQPMIQDDFTSYPIESFSGNAVQLANNGQWLMAAPSRTNNNYLLFHFCDDGSGFSFKEIPLPTSSELDDLALTIDNEKGDAYAGLLSKFHYPALKNVQVVHYSMEKQQFDFDSSYRFSTLAGNKFKNDNLVHESFISIPRKGFLLLKEYGKTFSSPVDDYTWDPESFFADLNISNSIMPVYTNVDGYTKFNKLTAASNEYQRGDLSLFYFPAQKNDSCWSGLISKQQNSEMNSPNLSYVLFPEKDKLALLYNSFFKDNDQYGSSTMLDNQGNMLNDGGVIFWKFNVLLNFQNARQIDANEFAVPYKDNQRNGFAIIKF